MNSPVRLTLSGLEVRAVHVPMNLPLATTNGTVGIAPLALIDLHTTKVSPAARTCSATRRWC